MGNQFLIASDFLISTLTGLVILVVMLRLMLQWVRTDFHNPVAQFILKVTNPMVVPLRRVIPSIGRIDMATVVALFVLQIIAVILIQMLYGRELSPLGLVVMTCGELIGLVFNVYLFAILIQVILSWVSPGNPSPISYLLYDLTSPVMMPARRILKPIHGFDLSPMLAMIVLVLLNILVAEPILQVGQRL